MALAILGPRLIPGGFFIGDPMKLIRYIATWFSVGTSGQSEAKYVAGTCYPVTDETKSHALQGVAEEIDAPADFDKAEAAATKAEAKAAEASDAAIAARELAEAAASAKSLTAEVAPAADAPQA